MPTMLSETSTDPAVEQENAASAARGPVTSTGPTVSSVLQFDIPEPVVVLPAHSTRIGDYIANAERDENWKRELAKARVRFADEFLSNEGVTIRTLRLRRGLSQAQLALAIQSSQSHVARIELGRTDPGYDTFKKLATALDEDIGDVVKAYGVGKDRREFMEPDL